MEKLTANYESMHYNRCGHSGLKLPALSLGLWYNFGGGADPENIRQMIRTAFEAGITHFDLANNYGPPPGSAESNFGSLLKKDFAGHRDELIISTKAGHLMWPGPYGEGGSKKYLTASLDQSLRRMGLEYVDIFYSHCPDPHTPLEETMDALACIVRSGKALYVGISKYAPEQTARAAAILQGMGTRLLIHQPPYSILDRRFERDGLFAALDELGMGCICFCPLAQGLLTDKYLSGIPAGSRAASDQPFLKKENITPELVQTLTKLNALAARRGQTLAQMALAWVLRHNSTASALIGASSPRQITQNVETLRNLSFTPEELNEIDTLTSYPQVQ